MTRKEAINTAVDAADNDELGWSRPDWITAFERALAECGYVVVPLEATEAMLAAAGYADATEEGKDYIRFRYSAMIAAQGE